MKRLAWLSTILCLVSLTFLISLTSPKSLFASTTVRFLYDGDGIRVAKIEEGKTTLYVGDLEKNITTGEATRYYSIAGKRVAVKDKSGTNYIVSNHLGSLTSLTDISANPKSEIRYYPYGTVRTKTGTTIASRQYTSQINDDSTGFYFYNARYYNPQIGNFIQADNNLSSLNRYGFVNNNPIKFFDPNGNEAVDSLAQYLCQAEQPDCTNLSQRWWGGTSQEALEGWKGTGAAANRALRIASGVQSAIGGGHIDPKKAAYKQFNKQEINALSASAGEFAPAFTMMLNQFNSVSVDSVNMALILAIAGQESGWAQDPLHDRFPYALYSLGGQRLLWSEEKILKGAQHWYITNDDIDGNVVAFIYQQRMDLGRLNGSGSYSMISPDGKINFEYLINYPGKNNYNELWMNKVQAYYDAFVKFANDNPEEYGWFLDDLTQFFPPSNSYSSYGPM